MMATKRSDTPVADNDREATGDSAVAGLALITPVRVLHAPPVKRDPYCQNGYNAGRANPESRLRALKAQSVARGANSGSRPPPPHGGSKPLHFRRAGTASNPTPTGEKLCDLPDDLSVQGKTILEVGKFECHWPTSGHGADMLMCSALAQTDSPYCPIHHKVAYKRD